MVEVGERGVGLLISNAINPSRKLTIQSLNYSLTTMARLKLKKARRFLPFQPFGQRRPKAHLSTLHLKNPADPDRK